LEGLNFYRRALNCVETNIRDCRARPRQTYIRGFVPGRTRKCDSDI